MRISRSLRFTLRIMLSKPILVAAAAAVQLNVANQQGNVAGRLANF